MKESKKTLKTKERGITLIALVITIIVLLILAGVSIAMLTGENGILSQAQKADVETRGAAVEEAKNLWETNKTLDENTGENTAESLEELVNRLVDESLLTKDEKDLILGNEEKGIEATGQVTIGSRTIVFGTEGPTLADVFCDDLNCTEEGHLHIGDYVDYKPTGDEEGRTTAQVVKEDTGYSTTQNFTMNTEDVTWRVLGKDGDNILLISGAPIKKDGSDPYLIMQGAESYINCVPTLNKVCGIYGNTSLGAKARSITVDDINKVVGVTVENNQVHKKGDSTNIDILPQQGAEGLGYSWTYKSGDYAPENYMNDEYGEKYATIRKVGDKENYNSYGYERSSLGLNDKIENMLFAGTTQESNFARSYWLASPGSYGGGSGAGFGPGAVDDGGVYCGDYDLFYSDGYWCARRLAVRPVVSLPSDISSEEVPKSENQDKSSIEDAYWAGASNQDPTVDSGYVDEGVGVVGEIAS